MAVESIEGVTCVSHPLVAHKLSILRDRTTPTSDFRRILREIGFLLAYEATRDLPMQSRLLDTPLETMDAPVLAGKKAVVASVLRAGDGLAQGMLDLIPSARVAHIGLYRDHETLKPVEYYFKAPSDLDKRVVLVADPMLATGNSAIEACSLLKARGATALRFVCLLAAPEGASAMRSAHPDVPIVTASLDRCLSPEGYILPGLGDAGDRLFGTK